MFDKWLRPQDVEQPDGLLEYQLLADDGLIEDDELVERLGHEVMRNYLVPGELANVFDDLGAPEVAGYLRKNKFPVDRKIRHGDFGEIVTGALYRRVRRWCVPVLKLRYKQTPAQAVQGTDVLAFRFRQDPPAIAVPEVKTRASRDNRVGSEAYDSLEKVLDRLDESIHFLMARCADRGQVFLARRLGALLREPGRRRVERHMLFVHDAASWKEDIVAGLGAKVTQRTELTVVKIDDLKEFVGRVYEAAETAPGSTTSRGTDNGTAAGTA
ncbi:Hachiman antiphage defense system protein HamA [Streptomyces sp. NPDC059743]|uniref:Hachiman antiphage defense system protein HamA n=1 Tax=Streptomyces sp. NPDC059743 TaxID=3346928 RepID=UPI00365C1EF2